MAAPDSTRIHVSVHLDQHSTVSFDASNVWPSSELVDGAGTDPASVADLLARRLTTEGFVGFSAGAGSITLIPAGAVKRVDVSVVPKPARSR
jgi:hypothetical protein